MTDRIWRSRASSAGAARPESSAWRGDHRLAERRGRADTVGSDTHGYDTGKKINGRKRFIVTDPSALLVVVCVIAASVQDRDGARTTRLSAYLTSPVRFVLADAGFAGRLVDRARAILATTLHIMRKPKGQQGFVRLLLPVPEVLALRWDALAALLTYPRP